MLHYLNGKILQHLWGSSLKIMFSLAFSLGGFFLILKFVAWLSSSPLWMDMVVKVAKIFGEISATLRYSEWMDVWKMGETYWIYNKNSGCP